MPPFAAAPEAGGSPSNSTTRCKHGSGLFGCPGAPDRVLRLPMEPTADLPYSPEELQEPLLTPDEARVGMFPVKYQEVGVIDQQRALQ